MSGVCANCCNDIFRCTCNRRRPGGVAAALAAATIAPTAVTRTSDEELAAYWARTLAATTEPEDKVTFAPSGELGWGVPPGQPRYVVPTMAPTSAPTSTPTPAALPSGGNDPILWTQPAVQEQAASMDIDSSQADCSGLSQPVRDLRLSTLAEADAGTLL